MFNRHHAMTLIMVVVFVAFLITGLALPVLPLHVHQDLGFGAFVVGLITSSQFGASFLSRMWSGHYADSRGAKRALVAGLLAAAIAGLLYLMSIRFTQIPVLSVTILLLGRALLGAAESFIITGALCGALALADARNAGKVMAWVGIAMYIAFAIGAPIGAALYAANGFMAIGWATMLLPLGTLALIIPLPSVVPTHRDPPKLLKVANAVWMPGLALACSSLGFGAITTFVALLFVEKGWSPAWLAFTAFAVTFSAARLVFGHLPDRLGGATVALVSILIEAAGLLMVWLAPEAGWAVAGTAVTGLGYALVFPGLGVEAVRRVPPQNRGLAMGTYTAFLDLALALSGPALGLIARATSLAAVFLAAALVVLCGAAITLRLAKSAANSLVEQENCR